MAYVYQHIRLDTNEVFYVGIGKLKYRPFSKHGRNKHWWNIVNKYGYRVEIIYDNLPYDLSLKMEEYLIYFYGRTDLKNGTLINKNQGGGGLLGYKTPIEVIKKRISKIKGRKLSEELKNKIRISNIGKKRSDKTRNANRLANLGKKLSEEHKNKISKSLLNNKNKAKFKKGNSVINEETGEVYKSLSMAAKIANVPIETFRNRLLKLPHLSKPFKYLNKNI